jgi:beta-lactamase class A
VGRFAFVLLVMLACIVPAAADQIAPKAAIERLFTSDKLNPDWFAAAFTAQVPVSQLQGYIDQWKSQYGPYRGVSENGDHFSTDFDKASIPTFIKLDADGRIIGLFFQNPIPKPGMASSSAANAVISPENAISRLFTADKASADWFAASFLAQVSIEQVQSIVSQYRAQLGVFRGVHAEGDHYVTEFEKGTVVTYATLDPNGRFVALLLKNPVMKPQQSGAVIEQMKQLPGKVSVLIEEGGRDRAAFNADEALAVGSTFKLAVLSALRRQIDAHRRAWAQVVALRSDWKSLPSGVLQNWPDGSQLTLNTIASLMISISDNTAADGAARTVGRSVVQGESPKRNNPFLTTREAFQLKDPRNADLLSKWRSGGILEKRNILASLRSRPSPKVNTFLKGGVVAQDVEWFFTTRELCVLMGDVADLPLMSINPGVADATAWKHVAFKGGSEPGVLNLTTQVTNKNGKTICVSATWNDGKPVDEKRFEALYGSLLSGLK